MNAVWAPVIAALGASFLTGLLVLARDFWRDRRDGAARLRTDRAEAYRKLMTISGLIVHTAGAMHLAMETRSGLKEGVNVAAHISKPLDALQLDDRLRRDTEPLYEALSMVWVIGSEEAINAANELAQRCGQVIGTATARGEARTNLSRYLAGEKWTERQLEEWQKSIDELANARIELAQVARREVGLAPAAFSEGSSTI